MDGWEVDCKVKSGDVGAERTSDDIPSHHLVIDRNICPSLSSTQISIISRLTMASPLFNTLRTAPSGLCKQCITTSRTTLPKTTRSSIKQHAFRPFSSTPIVSRQRTVQEAKSRYRLGPFSWQSGLLFLAAGTGLTFYFRYEKARMSRQRIAEANKGMGKPLVGGPFHLVDHHGKEFTEADLVGKYSLVYFGFTHCPDICPEELDKMAGMIEKVKEKHGEGKMRSVFISCDPARDTPEVLRRYLREFHPDILGLVGTWEEVKSVCKAYRVYFSTPPDVKPGQDYLVDHSIYFYLMGEFSVTMEREWRRVRFADLRCCLDPEGDFVEAIGRNFTVDAAAKVINDHIADWKGKIDTS